MCTLTRDVTDDASLCKSLGSPRVFLFSLPHGTLGDSILEGLEPHISAGDIIIDAANEHWQNTERRQARAAARGILYIGMGVSGGYQAARRGPSLCPGGSPEAVGAVMPLLEKVAARDARGNPCVGHAGLGGAGHYVKMVGAHVRARDRSLMLSDTQRDRAWYDGCNSGGLENHEHGLRPLVRPDRSCFRRLERDGRACEHYNRYST